MTDATTTADVLAAWELVEEHGLSVAQASRGWGCGKTPDCVGRGETLTAAVKDWAEAAGVPWPSVKVVPMWAWSHRGETRVVQASRYGAQSHADACGMSATVVPCEVVIRETKGV